MRPTLVRYALSLSFLVLVPAPSVEAQPLLGLRGGAAFSSFGSDGLDQLDERRRGALVGVILGVRVERTLSLEAGVEYVRKGGLGTIPTIEGDSPIGLEIDYLQLPLVARWEPAVGTLVRPALFAGPAVALEMACEPTEQLVLALSVTCDDGEGGSRRAVDWGVVLGLGAAVDLGRTTFRLDLRHDRGLRDLYGETDDLAVENRSVVVTLGFVARLGR